MEIKHPPENGSCSCVDCYKKLVTPMSKLDELGKELVVVTSENWLNVSVKEWREMKEEGYRMKVKEIEEARREEREALKKMVEGMAKSEKTAREKEEEDYRIGYNSALSDLLNELK